MTRFFNARLVMLFACGLVLALVAIGSLIVSGSENGAEAAGAPPTGGVPASRSAKSAVLVTAAEGTLAPSPAGAVALDGPASEQYAAQVLEVVPFPVGRNSAVGYDWAKPRGGVSTAEIENQTQFRAACDWMRSTLEVGSVDAERGTILQQIPDWPVFRGSPFAATIKAALDAAVGGDLGPLAAHEKRTCIYDTELGEQMRRATAAREATLPPVAEDAAPTAEPKG